MPSPLPTLPPLLLRSYHAILVVLVSDFSIGFVERRGILGGQLDLQSSEEVGNRFFTSVVVNCGACDTLLLNIVTIQRCHPVAGTISVRDGAPHKLHKLSRPLLRQAELGIGFSYQEAMLSPCILEAFYLESYHPLRSSMNLDHSSSRHYRMYRVDAIPKTQDAGMPEEDH
ncbi:hypothetical protein Tco_0302592 [Tanacetum coccineum]